MDTLKLYHVLNPLHIYCRLMDDGMTSKEAGEYAKWYEEKIWKESEKVLRNEDGT